MKKLIIITALLVSSFANAQTANYSAQTSSNILMAPFVSTGLTSFITFCSAGGDCRAIAESKDDAAEFLATNGEVRTAKLQSAFNVIRAENANLQVSDLELAEAILAL